MNLLVLFYYQTTNMISNINYLFDKKKYLNIDKNIENQYIVFLNKIKKFINQTSLPSVTPKPALMKI